MNKRPVKIKLSEEAQSEYNELQKRIVEEQKRGLSNSFHMQLKKAIDREIESLKIDPQKGIHIPQRNVPKKLFHKYGTKSFWKINLPYGWRMVYTITGNKVEIITFILRIVDHDEYNKMFDYRKN